MSFWEGVIAMLGLTALTIVTRGFFFLSSREVPIPGWLRQGLRYAPLAAMAAVVVPQIITNDGRLITTLADARIYAALAGGAWFFWRRSIFGTLICGLVVLLALRHGLGW